MGRAASLYAKVSPRLATRPGATLATRLHGTVYRLSGGRLGGRLLGADVLVLRTTGRKSGRPRESPLFYVRDGEESFAVVASNAAAPTPPAWWLNLQADPDAVVVLGRQEVPVHARRADEAETARLWPRLQAMYEGYDHYRSLATREMPVVLLGPPRVLSS